MQLTQNATILILNNSVNATCVNCFNIHIVKFAMSLNKSRMKQKGKLSYQDKLLILEKLEMNMPISKICEMYKVHKSTISRIKCKKSSIHEYLKATNIPASKIKRVTTIGNMELEKALYQWFVNERLNHNVVNDYVLQCKAVELHESLSNEKEFKASMGWIQKFKKRHSIRLLKITGEKLSTNDSSVPQFLESFMQFINDSDLVPDQIYNADESGLVYKFLQDKALVTHNEVSAPGHKLSKERITIMPCTNASGQHKLPLMIIGKSKTPRCFKNINLPRMHYRSSKNAWQTRSLFKEWFFDTYVPSVKEYLLSKGLPPKALLLLDNATAHSSANELKTEDGNISVYFFPPNTTALLQPLDQNIIKTIKQSYRKKLLYDLITKPGSSIHERLSCINLKDVVFLITESW